LHFGARSAVASATAGLRPAAASGRRVLLFSARYAVCGGCCGCGQRGNGATQRRYLLFAAGLAAAATLAQGSVSGRAGMNQSVQNPSFNLAALPVRDLDRQLARQLLHYETNLHSNASTEQLEALQLAGLMVSVALGKGQVCLPLSQCWVSDLQEPWHGIGPQRLHSLLADCATVYVACRDSAYAQQPLVLAGQRLYLARYYFYEQDVLAQLEQRLASPLQVDDAALATVLNTLFPALPVGQTDWQKVAAATACLQRFTVITGGPGTGKTTTVTRLLSALLSTQPGLSIALAAPTGKAAARMTESICNAKLKGALPYAEQIPDDSFTLHRLLGWTPNGFRYNAQRHLPFDCVVVD